VRFVVDIRRVLDGRIVVRDLLVMSLALDSPSRINFSDLTDPRAARSFTRSFNIVTIAFVLSFAGR